MPREIFDGKDWKPMGEVWKNQVEDLRAKSSKRSLTPEEERKLRELEKGLRRLDGEVEKPSPKFHI